MKLLSNIFVVSMGVVSCQSTEQNNGNNSSLPICDFDEKYSSFCSTTSNILMIKECENLDEQLTSCMEMHRGPRGYKMIHANVEACDSTVGINSRGFFTYTNALKNGVKFECQSLINSKVSITSYYSDGDVEHDSNHVGVQMDTMRIKQMKMKNKNGKNIYGFNVKSDNFPGPGNIEYSVDSCELIEYLGHKKVLNRQQIVNKNCIMSPSNNSTFTSFDAKYHRMIPVGNDVTRLMLLRDELYAATDVTFELNCDIRLCLMTEKDSLCAEELYDTSLCDTVTY